MDSSLLSRPPEEGARLLALSFLDQAAEARPRLADPDDAEALHDFRVGLRRLRSCLRAYRSYLKGSISKKLAKRLKRLAASTGPGRDTEAQIEWLRGRRAHLAPHHRAGLAWLVARLDERMRDAYEDMREEIEDEFLEVEEGLRRRLSVYHAEIHLDPSVPRETLAGATAAILHRQVAELEEHLARVEDVEDQEEAHEARISAKRVRYLLEPFAEEIEGAGAIVRRFKGLQDLLGDLHDSHVLETELAEAVEAAAVERAGRILALALADAPDERLLRAERRRDHEAGVISLARLNRARRDRLFAALEAEWLEGKGHDFLRAVEGLSLAITQPGTLDSQPSSP